MSVFLIKGSGVMYRQVFTHGGMWGAIHFVLGPLISGFGYWLVFAVNADTRSPSIFGLLLFGVGGLGFWLSFPMMLIGREFIKVDNG